MPNRIAFSPKSIAKLAIPATGRVTYYDTKEPSLGLRIDANGRRSFFWLRNGHHGKNIFKSLGEHPSVKVDEARQNARGLTSKLAAWRLQNYQGVDPFAVASTAPTLAEAFDAYAKKRLASHSAHPERAEKADRWMLEKYLSDFSNKPLDVISDRDVRAMHRHIVAQAQKEAREKHRQVGEKHGHTVANRAVQMLRRVFEWSIRKEKLFAGPNPARGVDFYPSEKRKRFLDAAELARLFTELRAEPNTDLRDFVLLSLFTAARRGDVSSMAWKDLTGNVWNIPSPKGGEQAAYTVQLPAEAMEILEQRRRRAESGGTKQTDPNTARLLAVYVFPSSANQTGHVTEWKRGWKQLLKRAQIGDLHIHDLRRTLASWQAGLGYNLPTIGATLGHAAGSSATSVYARLDVSVVRKAVETTVGAMGWKPKPAAKPARKRRAPRALPAVATATK